MCVCVCVCVCMRVCVCMEYLEFSCVHIVVGFGAKTVQCAQNAVYSVVIFDLRVCMRAVTLVSYSTCMYAACAWWVAR